MKDTRKQRRQQGEKEREAEIARAEAADLAAQLKRVGAYLLADDSTREFRLALSLVQSRCLSHVIIHIRQIRPGPLCPFSHYCVYTRTVYLQPRRSPHTLCFFF